MGSNLSNFQLQTAPYIKRISQLVRPIFLNAKNAKFNDQTFVVALIVPNYYELI